VSQRDPNPSQNVSQTPDTQNKTTQERVDKQSSEQTTNKPAAPQTDLSDKEARAPNMK